MVARYSFLSFVAGIRYKAAVGPPEANNPYFFGQYDSQFHQTVNLLLIRHFLREQRGQRNGDYHQGLITFPGCIDDVRNISLL